MFKRKPWGFLTALAGLAMASAYCQAEGDTVRVSRSAAGLEANGASAEPSLSANGRFTAFSSEAFNLIDGDTNGVEDIFVQDLATGAIDRVSLSSRGSQAKGPSITPSISADGRFIAFASSAPNLAAGDTNRVQDIFVFDRVRRSTRRISVATDGTQANGRSGSPVISADGRFVAFWSLASNLTKAPPDTPDKKDDSDKDEKKDSKDDKSDKDKADSADSAGTPSQADKNGMGDIFLHDRSTHATIRVSVSTAGKETDGASDSPAISADGAFVAFVSEAKNLVSGATAGTRQVYVRDVRGKTTEPVSISSRDQVANAASGSPSLSADGRYVAFSSLAGNLVNTDANGLEDIFVRDRFTNRTTRVSLATGSGDANGASQLPILSADGRFVAFRSAATNLTADGATGRAEYFIFDRQAQITNRALRAADGGEAETGADDSPFTLSADGRFLAFSSSATNLVSGDGNFLRDIFVRDRLLEISGTSDLEVSTSVVPASGPGPRVIQISVTNHGPDSAENTVLIDRLPTSVRLNAVTPSHGSCDNARLMICRLGALSPGETAQITISGRRIRPKSAAANYAAALSDCPDPAALNNSNGP